MKKLFKSKYIPALLVLLLISNSCSEEYLEVENKNQLAVSSFFKTQQDALFAINTCYYGLAGRGMHGLDWYFMFNSFEDRILFETPNMDEITINSTTGQVDRIFQDLCIGLFRTSSVIDNLLEREIPDLDEDLKQRYLGEAYALKAAYYFHLVTLFNKPFYYDEYSVPEDPNRVFPNADPVQFWDKILEDLEFAIDALPDTYPPSETGRVTKGMANALLGKALLYKHYHYYVRFGNKGSSSDIADLERAKEAFLDVMNSGIYSLVQPQEPKTRLDYIYAHLSNFSYVDLPSENNVYTGENTTESVWMIQYSDDRFQNGWLPAWQWTGHLNSHYFGAHFSSFRNHEIHPALWQEFETAGAPAGFDRDPRAYSTCYLDGDILDFRPDNEEYYNVAYKSGVNNKSIANNRGLNFPGQPSVGFGLKKYYFPVYYENNAPGNSPTNRNYIRYADVLLMYAEVMYLLGDDGSGLEALNEVRRRVDMPDIEALTTDAIIHERDVELATEGHRWLDLIRWSFDPEWGINWDELEWGINSANSVNPFVVGKHEYLPLPLREINLGRGALEQNPGW